ncbi:helix-turn-helix domain-containing protein [Pseudoclavibacter chungangensis]|uniref:Helix-turn-helix domain-containing protein n=2 Tax=Pseudoclavibacter chungangensis TaxID=587635 RepID=A0A7J5BYW3_9MICO|nr:helix-turn-helix domain-containing protein [Pseudoclavibacter chungangensis]
MGAVEDGSGRARVGDSSVCAHIATTIVAVALRAWVQRGCAPDDWLVRTHDPYVALALDAIHDEPGRAWTVGALATVATMSRSVFAERFRATVGRSPANYLAEVRMAAAMGHLERGELSVAETAALLGYESEAGFSRAFRRHVGLAPSAWRRERTTVASV